jgi:polyisoprenoid-binding protein YceI
MLVRVAFALVAVTLFGSMAAAADKLTLNEEKSKISFLGKKPGGEHKGGFKKFKVDATADKDDPTKSTLKIEIQVEGLWADDPKLETHLKAPDFFNVKKYPTAVFESTKIDVHGEGEAKITGKLTMLGKTQEITVPVKVDANDDKVEVSAKFKIDRTKWGMDMGVSDGKIDKEVEITADLVFKP